MLSKKDSKAANRALGRAFEECYYQHFPKIKFYALSYLKDYDLAESLAQDTFMKLWESRHRVDFNEDLISYLIVLTRNGAISLLRKKNNHLKYKDSELLRRRLEMNLTALHDSSALDLYSKEVEELVQKGLEKMPERVKSTFLLSRQSFFTNAEISKKKKISIKTVESHITIALKILRTELKDYFAILIGFFLL